MQRRAAVPAGLLPVQPAVGQAAKAKLSAVVAAANKAGVPIRVGIIQNKVDLGSDPSWWNNPQGIGSNPPNTGYSGFLDEEIVAEWKHGLLVVMPAGYGYRNGGKLKISTKNGISSISEKLNPVASSGRCSASSPSPRAARQTIWSRPPRPPCARWPSRQVTRSPPTRRPYPAGAATPARVCRPARRQTAASQQLRELVPADRRLRRRRPAAGRSSSSPSPSFAAATWRRLEDDDEDTEAATRPRCRSRASTRPAPRPGSGRACAGPRRAPPSPWRSAARRPRAEPGGRRRSPGRPCHGR